MRTLYTAIPARYPSGLGDVSGPFRLREEKLEVGGEFGIEKNK